MEKMKTHDMDENHTMWENGDCMYTDLHDNFHLILRGYDVLEDWDVKKCEVYKDGSYAFKDEKYWHLIIKDPKGYSDNLLDAFATECSYRGKGEYTYTSKGCEYKVKRDIDFFDNLDGKTMPDKRIPY